MKRKVLKTSLFTLCLAISMWLITSCDAVKKASGYPGSDGVSARATSVKPTQIDTTDFYQLCAYGKKSAVAKAVKKGTSVNALDKDGFSPLFHAVLGTPAIYAEGVSAIQTALRQDNDKALYEKLDATPIQTGNFEVVQLLLQNGANVQLKDRSERTIFAYAALFCSDVRILQALVDAGADHTETLAAQYQQPLLNFASFTNTSPECISYLVKLNGNVGQGNQYGTTPIMWAAMYNPNPQVIDALIAAGADINDPGHKDGYTPLHWAVRCNRSSLVAEHIIKLGADINKEDKYGSSPLLWAICNKNPKDVLTEFSFISKKSSYDKLLKYLEDFQQEGKPELVPLLLKYNPTTESMIEAYELAYVLAPAEIANAILEKLSQTQNVVYEVEDLELLCLSKDEAKIQALAQVLQKPENRANIDVADLSYLLTFASLYDNQVALTTLINDFGITADYSSAYVAITSVKNQTYLELILQACNVVNRQDGNGKTLLYHAVDQGNGAAVKALLANGAKIDMRAGNNYHTELITAVSRSQPNEQIVRALINSGADVNARDKDGQSVLIHAVRNNRTSTVASILINAGADKTAKYSGKYPYQWCNYYIQDTNVYDVLYDAAPSYYYW